MIVTSLALAATVSVSPRARDIERILRGREFCLISIDACLDGETGKQIIPNTTYKVSNVVCRTSVKPKADSDKVQRSARCSYLIREMNWIDGQQIGAAQTVRGEATFDLFKLTDVGEKNETILTWRQRREPRN